jgi:hypothetical protein
MSLYCTFRLYSGTSSILLDPYHEHFFTQADILAVHHQQPPMVYVSVNMVATKATLNFLHIHYPCMHQIIFPLKLEGNKLGVITIATSVIFAG